MTKGTEPDTQADFEGESFRHKYQVNPIIFIVLLWNDGLVYSPTVTDFWSSIYSVIFDALWVSFMI